jgi:hypothetical protein
MLIKTAVFWGITRRHVVTDYRRFGTTYRSHPHGSRIPVGKLFGLPPSSGYKQFRKTQIFCRQYVFIINQSLTPRLNHSSFIFFRYINHVTVFQWRLPEYNIIHSTFHSVSTAHIVLVDKICEFRTLYMRFSWRGGKRGWGGFTDVLK